MKLKLLSILAISTLVVACSNNQEADNKSAANTGEKQIRIATESSFKPFSYLDASGNLVGFEIDLANALCQEMAAKCDIQSQDWDGLIVGLNAKKFDAVMAGMSATSERAEVVDFSDSYFNNTLVLLGQKGVELNANTLDDKNIAVQQATVSADYLTKNHPKTTIKAYSTQDNAYLDLTAGRVDGMLSDIVPALDWLKTEQGADFEVKGEPIDINDSVAIALRKNDPLKDEFNTALATLKQNGKYDELVDKYFDKTIIK
ncbi:MULTISPECIES: transporter substrate-binding domain-containing protein [unclassified Moraxella]|uniref:transporter substrate-binding domain-containing protein n=1 Tax=unclassified Moraxella TaxID=2685852 RepID=UPI00359EED9B